MLIVYVAGTGAAAILVAAVYFGWRFRTQKDFPTAIIAGAATVAAALLGAAITSYLTDRAKLEEEHRSSKTKVYTLCIKAIMSTLSQQDASEADECFNTLATWASPTVVKAAGHYSDYLASASECKDGNAYLGAWRYAEELFFAMRRDLNLNDDQLECGDLIRVGVTDRVGFLDAVCAMDLPLNPEEVATTVGRLKERP
jgi:hypothetical protein